MSFFHFPSRTFLFHLLAALALAPGAYSESLVFLAKDGTAQFHLILDSDPSGLDTTVAEDLVGTIEKISGAKVSTEDDKEGKIQVYLGEKAEFTNLPIDIPDLEEESYFLKVTPNAIYLIGGSPLGTSHAAYTLLRQVGCRWVMPGEIGECLPKSKDLSLKVQERFESPDFSFRDIWYAYGCSAEASKRRADWLRRNRMHRPPVQHGHNLTNTLAVFAPFEERPDLYSLENGVRTKNQICTSNPEAVALVVKAISEYLKKYPDTQAYSLCPDDNTDFCECENCTALDSGHMDRGGRPSVSDRYQVFLNQVLEGLSKEHPDVLVTHYAYNENHTDPPVNTPVHPNTGIFLTTSVFCSAHGIGDEFCDSRMDFKQLLSEWTAKTKHVYIYEYDPVPYSGGLPWPMWDAHGREMKVYKELGVQGFSFEGQDSWASYFPNYYIGAQMMWNAEQDYHPVFEDMLDSFFHEASAPMKEYYRILASKIGSVEKKVEWGLLDYPKYFPREVVERCRQALEQAEAKASDPIIKKRVEMVRMSFDEMDAFTAMKTAGPETKWDEYQQMVKRLEDSIQRMDITNEDFLLADIAREKTLAGISDRFAMEQGFINKWRICGPFDNVGKEGHNRVYGPEEGVDLTASYTGKEGETASWKVCEGPEWQGYVDLKAQYDQDNFVVAYAVNWITLDQGPKEVEFRVGSNDSVKVFLNGKEVWTNPISRPASADDDIVPVTLPKGTSQVLLKIGQTGRDWGFYFRITEPNSTTPVSGAEISIDPPK
ncbi:MAG: DUF4838 domain-containing protein [Candidatus Omnitrophica bacterium]|nr:DUF4838 domain-containing protein [Candidatus Omnitrophota bacterium]